METITRKVKVDRSRTPGQAVKAMEWRNRGDVDNKVLAEIPRGEDGEVEIIFFKIDHPVLDEDQLEQEYDSQALDPVDPYSLMAVYEEDPRFDDLHPSCTHWKNESGERCFASFRRWCNVRIYNFVKFNSWETPGLPAGWWFAGIIRK